MRSAVIESDSLLEAFSEERSGSFDPVMTLFEDPDDPDVCEFRIEPLERGHALTLGSAMRRYLYRVAEGYGVVGVWIAGAEGLGLADPVPGLESVSIEYFLAGVQFLGVARACEKASAPRRGWFDIEAERGQEILASSFRSSGAFAAVCPGRSFGVAEGRFRARAFIELGRGCRDARETERDLPGFFPTHTVYTPARQVDYSVDRARSVGARSRLDLLRLEIKTDGSVSAADLGRQAASDLALSYRQMEAFAAGLSDRASSLSFVASLESLGLLTRTENALLRAGLVSVADALSLDRRELMSLRSFGQNAYLDLGDALWRNGYLEPEGPGSHWLESGVGR